jgi:hypothetical protein
MPRPITLDSHPFGLPQGGATPPSRWSGSTPAKLPPPEASAEPLLDKSTVVSSSAPGEAATERKQTTSKLVAQISFTKKELVPLTGNSTRFIVDPALRDALDIGCTIYSITEVDPVLQLFNCDLKIMCRWHDPTLESDPDMKSLLERGCFANGDGPAPRQVGYVEP